MRDTNLPKAPKDFPDLVTCRVTPAKLDGYFDCLSFWASYCPHMLSFASSRYCRHPSAPEILARSKDKPA
jgi:hypothetical protein